MSVHASSRPPDPADSYGHCPRNTLTSTNLNGKSLARLRPHAARSLEDQVAKVELQARLKVAGQLASGEASNAVVILDSAAQSRS